MWMEERYPDFKWRAEVLCVEFVSGKKTFTVKLDPVGVINIKGCNTVSCLYFMIELIHSSPTFRLR